MLVTHKRSAAKCVRLGLVVAPNLSEWAILTNQSGPRNVVLDWSPPVLAAIGHWERCARGGSRKRHVHRSVPSLFRGKATRERPFCADCGARM